MRTILCCKRDTRKYKEKHHKTDSDRNVSANFTHDWFRWTDISTYGPTLPNMRSTSTPGFINISCILQGKLLCICWLYNVDWVKMNFVLSSLQSFDITIVIFNQYHVRVAAIVNNGACLQQLGDTCIPPNMGDTCDDPVQQFKNMTCR